MQAKDKSLNRDVKKICIFAVWRCSVNSFEMQAHKAPRPAPKARRAVLPITYPTALFWTPVRADVSIIYTAAELDPFVQEHVYQMLSLSSRTIQRSA